MLPIIEIGWLADLDPAGAPLVDFPKNTSGAPVAARSVTALRKSQLGKEVVLMFESGIRSKPVVLGLIHGPSMKGTDSEEVPREVDLDGERVTLSAEKEIVLRCGKATITLTRAGKIIIRGAYVLNRSSGVNRIKGASVQIN
jgi:hypothetical protein